MANAERERDLVLAWQRNPGPATATPMLDALQPVFTRVLGQLATPDLRIPRPAVQGLVLLEGLNLLKKYDPSKVGKEGKSAKVSSFLFGNLRNNTQTELEKYKNIVRIPERLGRKLTDVKEAEELLLDKLGRLPTDAEISFETKVPEKHVARIRKNLGRQDFVASYSPQQTIEEQGVQERAWDNMRAELPVQERAIADFMNINREMKESELDRQLSNLMNLPRPQIRQIRQEINEQWRDHIGRVM